MDGSIGRLLRLSPSCRNLVLEGCVFSPVSDIISSDYTFLSRLQSLVVRPLETAIPPPLHAVISAVESRLSTLQSVEVEVYVQSSDDTFTGKLESFSRSGILVRVLRRDYVPMLYSYEENLLQSLTGLLRTWVSYASRVRSRRTRRILIENAPALGNVFELIDRLKSNHMSSEAELEFSETVAAERRFLALSSVLLDDMDIDCRFKERTI
ncbi:hypothetical protein WG66_003696 [Moniliophthora roreri]|nr:hypothetical protein WG66_003696 [Moniliophthora roreri]